MSSFLEELRAADEQLRRRAAPLEIDVPGRGGQFCVRYRPPRKPDGSPDRDALTSVLAALSGGGALDEAQELQLIVDCCDEVLVRRSAHGELERPAGGPLRFDASDERWGTVKTARDAVRTLFATDVVPLGPSRHAGALIDYLQGVEAEIAARVEGKSDAAGAS